MAARERRTKRPTWAEPREFPRNQEDALDFAAVTNVATREMRRWLVTAEYFRQPSTLRRRVTGQRQCRSKSRKGSHRMYREARAHWSRRLRKRKHALKSNFLSKAIPSLPIIHLIELETPQKAHTEPCRQSGPEAGLEVRACCERGS